LPSVHLAVLMSAVSSYLVMVFVFFFFHVAVVSVGSVADANTKETTALCRRVVDPLLVVEELMLKGLEKSPSFQTFARADNISTKY
jgi:hypothetical protein